MPNTANAAIAELVRVFDALGVELPWTAVIALRIALHNAAASLPLDSPRRASALGLLDHMYCLNDDDERKPIDFANL